MGPPAGTGAGLPGRDPDDLRQGRGASEGPIIRHRRRPPGPPATSLESAAITAAGALLALVVLWAPLPFGSVEPEAGAALRLAAALALFLAAPAARARRLSPVALPALTLGGLALLGLLQSLPAPPWLVALLSPGHARTWGRAAELLAAPATAGGPEVGWPRLTLDPAASREAALTALALAVLLLAAALVGRRRNRRRWLAAAAVGAGLFQAIYGLRQLLAGSMEVWGVRVLGVGDRLRGTFVNPNHVAYLLEISLAVAFAAGWWALVHARRERNPEARLLLLLPPAVVWLGLLGALVLTRSRAGLLAVVAGAAVQGLLVALVPRVGAASRRRGRDGGRWARGSAGLLAALVGLVVVGGIVSGEAFSRLLGTSLSDVAGGARARVAGLTLELWLRFPLTGSGLGTYRDAFLGVEPAGLAGGAWHHAHNGYLELLATGGLVGLALVAVGLVALLRRLLQVLARGRRSEDRAAALAALGALAAVAVHEAFDFGLLLPGNLYVLVVLCGAAAAGRVEPRGGAPSSAAVDESPAVAGASSAGPAQ